MAQKEAYNIDRKRIKKIRRNSPQVGDDDVVVSVDAHHADVLHHDPGDEHTDQGGEGGQGEEPSPEVGRDAEDGEAEKLAARGGVLAEYRVHDAPQQQAQQEQAQQPGEFSVARAKRLGAGFPPTGWLPRWGVVATVASRAKQIQPRPVNERRRGKVVASESDLR